MPGEQDHDAATRLALAHVLVARIFAHAEAVAAERRREAVAELLAGQPSAGAWRPAGSGGVEG